MAHVIAAVNHSGKGKRPKLTDFLLTWAKRRQTAEEQLALFKALASRQGRTRGDDR